MISVNKFVTLNCVRKNGCWTAVFWMQKHKREKQPRVSAVGPAVEQLSTTVRVQGQECAVLTGGTQGVLNGGFPWGKPPHKGSVHTHTHTLYRNLNGRTGPSFWTIICCSDQDLVTRSDIWRLKRGGTYWHASPETLFCAITPQFLLSVHLFI